MSTPTSVKAGPAQSANPLPQPVSPAPPSQPRWVGPALAGWAGWGHSFWIADGLAEIRLIYNLGFRRIAIPFELFDVTGDALTRFINAVTYALRLGMDVYTQVHIDGNNQVNANAPWDQSNLYLEEIQDMAIALKLVLSIIGSSPRPSFTIVIGNELVGSPSKDWPTILTIYDTLLPNCARAIRQHLPGVKVYVPYMGDEQAGFLAAGMTSAGMMPKLLMYGTGPTLTTSPIYDGVDLHYLLETMIEAQQYIPSATAISLLSLFKEKYNLPVGIGEFSAVPMNPDGTVGSTLDLAMATAIVNLRIPCHYWQWWIPDTNGLCLKGNAPLLAAIGYPMPVAA